MSSEDNLCSSLESETVTYDKISIGTLGKTLKSIYLTGKEYIDGQLELGEAYTRCRRQYSFYSCKIKSEISDSISQRELITRIFKVGLIIISCGITLYMLSQLYKTVRMEEVQVTMVTALICLVVFNPGASALTIVMELIMHHQSNNQQSSGSAREVDKLETLIRHAVDCQENFDASMRAYCSEFEKSEIAEDLMVQRMDKINQINQFDANVKDFIERKQNPELTGRQKEVMQKCLSFLKGEQPSMLDAVFNSDRSTEEIEDRYYFKTSSEIRTRAKEILRYLDSTIDPTLIESYGTYFVDELEEVFNKLVIDVEKHAKHLALSIDFCDPIDSPIPAGDRASSIVNEFHALSMRIRRLRMLQLPEYSMLMKVLNPNDVPTWNTMLLKFDRSSYTTADLMLIIEMFLNNTDCFYFSPDTRDGTCVISKETITKRIDGKPYDLTLPVVTCEQTNANGCIRIKPNFSLQKDIYEAQDPDYLKADSLTYANTLRILTNLTNQDLPQNFGTWYRIEFDLIYDVLESALDSFEWKMEQFLEMIPPDQSVFIENVRDILVGLMRILNDRSVSNRLLFDKRKTVEDPKRYISFDQFEMKLEAMTEPDFRNFYQSVTETSTNVQFFNDRMNELDDAMESSVKYSKLFGKFIYIYFFVSFLLFVDFGFYYYTGVTIDSSMTNFLNKRKLNRISVEKKPDSN
jgi:hypothetical protein